MLQLRDLDFMTRMLDHHERSMVDADAVDDQFVQAMIAQTTTAIALMEAYVKVGTDEDVLAWAQEELDDTREDAIELAALLADLEEDDADPNDPLEN